MARANRVGEKTTRPRITRRVRSWWIGVPLGLLLGGFGGLWAAACAAHEPQASSGAEKAAAVVSAAPETVTAAEKMAICTFTNPSYAGECIEGTAIPEGSTAMKACLAILDCLNDPRCTKTYCDATTIRIGWELKSAEEE